MDNFCIKLKKGDLYLNSVLKRCNRYSVRFGLICLGALFFSCVRNSIYEIQENAIEKSISLTIVVPTNSIATYSLEEGTPAENHIDTLFINILENNVIKETKKLYGSALQTAVGSNNTINIALELENLTGGALTAEVFANRTEVKPVVAEIPLPDTNDAATWFMMSGNCELSYNGTAHSGTVHLVRNVAKLRVRISKHPACIPDNLIIDYSHIKVETKQVPDRTQLMAPPPIMTPAGLTYIADYALHTGTSLRPETPMASFGGGQIDSLYLYENYIDNNDYNDANTTQVKITIPSQEPGMPVKTAEYTYKIHNDNGYQIKRNNIYILDIKIVGQTLDPVVVTDILPWNDVDANGDIQGVTLNIDKSKVYISPANTQNNPVAINYFTDNTSITLDWSKVNPAHNIDMSVQYIQGMTGQIPIAWTGDGAPDYSFRDTVLIIVRNVIQSVVVEYNIPTGNFGNWIGTFHRWNQTGERIIKMRNNGEWTATVMQGTDFIMLNNEATKDVNWGTALAALGNDTGFDSNYPVSGGVTSLSGNGIIYFRVGMKSALAHVGAQPRYGIIEVTTREGVKKIYVRQGEEADYVMLPDDPNPADNNNKRPYSVKFSPFNLSDPQRGTGGGHISDHHKLLTGGVSDDRKFTDYPSQAGYFYQWNGGSGNEQKAFHPVNTVQAIIGWETASKAEWNKSIEPCPKGYRHPNDSLRSPITSEIRQSWYATPDNDTYGPAHPSDITLQNAVWGYYADGFFDRLAVGSSPNDVEATTVSFHPSVPDAPGNAEVAYAGLLIYNPASGSSLFLPTPGVREGSRDGALTNAGAMAAYWTNSPNGNNGWAFYLTPTSIYSYNNAYQSNGASVRCVKFDAGLPGSVD